MAILKALGPQRRSKRHQRPVQQQRAGPRCQWRSPQVKLVGALVEHLQVEYYGAHVPLNQIATVTAPDPRTLVVQSWDQNALKAIEKAIRDSDLGLNPSNKGDALYINIPPLTEERRKDLVRAVRQPHPPYEALGLKRGNEWVQINTNVLQIENEYYSFIRPKRVTLSGERPSRLSPAKLMVPASGR